LANWQEPNVSPESETDTFVAMQLEIDNWRCAGVPFYIRTGKHMSRRKTEITIRFKQAPHTPFVKCSSIRCRRATSLPHGQSQEHDRRLEQSGA
jgi:glucose-6-phosphate 1-dehydrogenase